MTTDDRSELGTLIACPSDPAPEKNPDGEFPIPTAARVVNTYGLAVCLSANLRQIAFCRTHAPGT